jgi:hypothetical protein
LSQGTPVVLFPGNTFKSEGIGPMLGLDIPVFDIQEREAILARIDDIVGHEDDIRTAISSAVSEARKSYDALSGYMNAIVDQRLRAQGNAAPEPESRLTPAVANADEPIRHQDIYRQRNYYPRPMRLKWLMKLRLLGMRIKPGYLQSIERTLTELP